MAGLSDMLENYRNWRGRSEWEQGKAIQDIYQGDVRGQEQFEKFGGFGTGSHGGFAGTFIGESGAARLGLQKLIEEAKKMHSEGAPRKEIWKKTLSMLAPDNNWIHEIPDTEAEIIDNARTGGATYLKHPLLKQAYPEQSSVKQLGMTNMPEDTAALFVPAQDKLDWSLGNKGAIYYPSGKTPAKEDLVHEFQHWVQEHPENKWSGGGNLEQFNPQEAEKTRDLLSWRREMERYMQDKGFDPKKNSDAWMNAENALINDYYNLGAHEFVPASEIRNEARNWMYRPGESKRSDIEDTVSAYGLDRRVTAHTPMDMYKRLWGEAQARLAEKRMDYTPEQRMNTYPWEDLDVPEEELIGLNKKGLARLLKR